MRIYKEISLEDFEAWSGAVDTMDTLYDLSQQDGYKDVFAQLEACMEDSSDEWDETGVNDFLWLENDTIAEWLGFEDWEELERVANGEDKFERKFEDGDMVVVHDWRGDTFVGTVVDFDPDDGTYLIECEDGASIWKDGEDVEEYEEE